MHHNHKINLNGILLCRQPKRVPSHWMQNIVTLHAFESSKNISGSIPQWMANM